MALHFRCSVTAKPRRSGLASVDMYIRDVFTHLRERLLSGSFYDSFAVTASGKSRPVPACHAALKRMFNAF